MIYVKTTTFIRLLSTIMVSFYLFLIDFVIFTVRRNVSLCAFILINKWKYRFLNWDRSKNVEREYEIIVLTLPHENSCLKNEYILVI